MQRGSPWYPGAAILFTLLLIASTPTFSQVLWQDEGKAQPRFIPESVLSGQVGSSLTAGDLKTLRAAIHAHVAQYSARWACGHQIIFDADPNSDVRWRSLKEKLQADRLVLRGQVIELEAGWSSWPGQTVTLVRLRVQEVLAGKNAPPSGSIVSYIQDFGDMKLDGERVCTLPWSWDYSAAVGDQILVTASGLRGNESEKELAVDPKTDLYPIRNDSAIVLNPTPKEASTIPLKTLRSWRPGK